MSKQKPSKTIAWNKISIKVPMAWEIDSLDKAHMLIGEEGSPELEIKWTDAPKKFTLEKYLKKFISKSQRILNIKIHELPSPGSFSHPEQHLDLFFFSWESSSSSGNGTLIFCNLCKRLTMIRFFRDTRISPGSPAHLILTSFKDHPGELTFWHLFGLEFSTPAPFELLEYSFKPGAYILNFKYKKTKLTIFSWGPASFLLSKTDLPGFAMIRLPQLKGFAKAGVCTRGNYLEWAYRQGRFKNAEILPFFNRYSLFTLFRICHDKQSNRILGVMIDSSKNFETKLIKGSIIGDV